MPDLYHRNRTQIVPRLCQLLHIHSTEFTPRESQHYIQMLAWLECIDRRPSSRLVCDFARVVRSGLLLDATSDTIAAIWLPVFVWFGGAHLEPEHLRLAFDIDPATLLSQEVS